MRQQCPLLSKCSPLSSTKQLLVVHRGNYKDLQLVKMERINDQLQLGTTQPYIKDLRNRVEEEQKDSKKQKSISFEGQLQDSLLNMTEMLYLYSQQHACLHKATPVNMSMWMGKLFKGPNLYEYLQAVNSC